MDEPRDWEPTPEEEPPESLQRKWDKEEADETTKEPRFSPCPHCEKSIAVKSFSCIYCGQRVFEESGLLGTFYKWIVRDWIYIIVAVTVLGLIGLTVLH